jgi:hypothetical protein
MDWVVDQIGLTPALALNQKGFLESAFSVARQTEKKLSHGNFAIRLNELIIHNSRTWFDEDNIRLYAPVVYGNVSKAKAVDFYRPSTFSFADIESCGKADLRFCGICNRVKRNCTCAAGCRRDRKRGLADYSSRNKQSHRCVSASFLQFADNFEAGEHLDGHLKVKDRSFTQEILAQ